MPKGVPVDLDAFHIWLHARADRLGRVKIVQVDLCAIFGMDKWQMSRIIKKLVDQGRMRRVSNRLTNGGYFVVEDPEVWKAYNQE